VSVPSKVKRGGAAARAMRRGTLQRGTLQRNSGSGAPAKREYTDEHAAAGVDADLPEIEVWPNQYRTGYEIEIRMPEFTSVCPKTGLPDHGTLVLRYVPDRLCLELKSLKMYTLAYRNLGIFQENVVNRMLADVVKYADPIRATLIGEFMPRGGVFTTITATYTRKKG
jgi:7-cyano-7-deazaguanine reductase